MKYAVRVDDLDGVYWWHASGKIVAYWSDHITGPGDTGFIIAPATGCYLYSEETMDFIFPGFSESEETAAITDARVHDTCGFVMVANNYIRAHYPDCNAPIIGVIPEDNSLTWVTDKPLPYNGPILRASELFAENARAHVKMSELDARIPKDVGREIARLTSYSDFARLIDRPKWVDFITEETEGYRLEYPVSFELAPGVYGKALTLYMEKAEEYPGSLGIEWWAHAASLGREIAVDLYRDSMVRDAVVAILQDVGFSSDAAHSVDFSEHGMQDAGRADFDAVEIGQEIAAYFANK